MSIPERPPEPQSYRRYEKSESDSSNLPVPDPTRLTTELVDRALAAFREVMETRLAALDKATELAAEKTDELANQSTESREYMRGDIDRAAQSLRELVFSEMAKVHELSEQKFRGIDIRFEERDSRTQLAAAESRLSLDAALAAAKEAVTEQNAANSKAIAKSEEATQKQIDSMQTLMQTSFKSVEDKIGDIKERVDRGEGGDAGRHESKYGVYAALAAVGTIVVVVSVLANILTNAGP